MKKLISLVLALALCLTAVAAFAEAATPSKEALEALAVSAETATVSQEAADLGVALDTTKAAVDASEKLLDKLSDAKEETNLNNLYENAAIEDTRADATPVDLTKAVSVTVAPMPVVNVSNADAANSAVVIEIETAVAQAALDFLQGFDPAPIAVFTYLKNGALVSVIIDYTIVPATPFKAAGIAYSIPLSVLADASGCPSFVNFVIAAE